MGVRNDTPVAIFMVDGKPAKVSYGQMVTMARTAPGLLQHLEFPDETLRETYIDMATQQAGADAARLSMLSGAGEFAGAFVPGITPIIKNQQREAPDNTAFARDLAADAVLTNPATGTLGKVAKNTLGRIPIVNKVATDALYKANDRFPKLTRAILGGSDFAANMALANQIGSDDADKLNPAIAGGVGAGFGVFFNSPYTKQFDIAKDLFTKMANNAKTERALLDAGIHNPRDFYNRMVATEANYAKYLNSERSRTEAEKRYFEEMIAPYHDEVELLYDIPIERKLHEVRPGEYKSTAELADILPEPVFGEYMASTYKHKDDAAFRKARNEFEEVHRAIKAERVRASHYDENMIKDKRGNETKEHGMTRREFKNERNAQRINVPVDATEKIKQTDSHIQTLADLYNREQRDVLDQIVNKPLRANASELTKETKRAAEKLGQIPRIEAQTYSLARAMGDIPYEKKMSVPNQIIGNFNNASRYELAKELKSPTANIGSFIPVIPVQTARTIANKDLSGAAPTGFAEPTDNVIHSGMGFAKPTDNKIGAKK